MPVWPEESWEKMEPWNLKRKPANPRCARPLSSTKKPHWMSLFLKHSFRRSLQVAQRRKRNAAKRRTQCNSMQLNTTQYKPLVELVSSSQNHLPIKIQWPIDLLVVLLVSMATYSGKELLSRILPSEKASEWAFEELSTKKVWRSFEKCLFVEGKCVKLAESLSGWSTLQILSKSKRRWQTLQCVGLCRSWFRSPGFQRPCFVAECLDRNPIIGSWRLLSSARCPVNTPNKILSVEHFTTLVLGFRQPNR